jgi:hypothetical protein
LSDSIDAVADTAADTAVAAAAHLRGSCELGSRLLLQLAVNREWGRH